MPKISETLLASLAKPTYTGGGLFTVGQNLGSMPERMRLRRKQEEEAKMLSAIDRSTPEGLMQLATFYGGKPDMESKKLAMEYSGEARKLAQQKAEQAALDRRKGQVQTLLTNYGMDALAEQVPNITDADELGDMVGAIQTHMLNNMPTQTVAQRRQLAAQRGITSEMFNKFSLAKVPDKAFNDFLAGQRGGKIEYFLDRDGEVKPFRVDGGQVWNREQQKWTSAQGLGLRKPPPELQKVLNLSNSLAEGVIQEGIKELPEGKKAARAALETIQAVDIQLDILGSGDIITGYGADFRKDLTRLAILLNPSAMAKHDEKVVGSEVYLGLAGKAVAEYISALGSGTGLSNKDLEFTERVTAATLSSNPKAMRELLGHLRQTSVNRINAYNELHDTVYNALETDKEKATMSLFPKVELPPDRPVIKAEETPVGEPILVNGVEYIVDEPVSPVSQ